MERKIKLLFVSLLIFGAIFRLFIVSGGNFIFNMDNGRDMVDVREMVVLGKLRLIGQTTAIEGFFYGPAWYYILSIPFMISGGDPYASIILEILLWFVGGYFLINMVYKYYNFLTALVISIIWVASNFILLGIQYAFNPNPILFLTPIFIYYLIKVLEENKLRDNIICWFLAGLFFHFEITVGLFMAPIIILAILISKQFTYFKSSNFFISLIFFGITFLPQFIFDLRHDFWLSKSLLAYRSGSHGGVDVATLERVSGVFRSFYDTFLPTLMNFKPFMNMMLIAFIPASFLAFKNKEFIKNKLTLISALLVFVPLLGLIPLKVELMGWHLNAVLIGAVILIGFIFYTFSKLGGFGKIISLLFLVVLTMFTVSNIVDYIQARIRGNSNNSHLKNEIAAIDYIYQQTAGKDFKVYVYMPSVIDYPYQYLFWWHGLKKYGYTPKEYAYSPNVPPYISQKEKLDTGKRPNEDSGLVFLIKESDQIGQRHLWENQFKNLTLVKTEKVGPLEIETRKEKSNPDLQ